MANNRYISSWNNEGWLVRVPTSYTHGEKPESLFQFANTPKKLKYIPLDEVRLYFPLLHHLTSSL